MKNHSVLWFFSIKHRSLWPIQPVFVMRVDLWCYAPAHECMRGAGLYIQTMISPKLQSHYNKINLCKREHWTHYQSNVVHYKLVLKILKTRTSLIYKERSLNYNSISISTGKCIGYWIFSILNYFDIKITWINQRWAIN